MVAWGLAWLADRAGLHRTYISDVERGMRNISLESIEKLAAALQHSISGLFDQGGIPSPPPPLVEILLVEDLATDIELTRRAFDQAKLRNPLHVIRDGVEALHFLFATGPWAHRRDLPLPQVTITAAQASTSVTGTMVVELDPVRAPKTVDNFLAYVNQTTPFLRNTLFHRAEPGVLIQAGGYVTGLSPKAATLAPIELESNNGMKNLRGTVGMARTTELNSATTQFYVNLADNADFDYVDASSPGYAVFGTVVSGMDVADSIGSVVTTSLLVSGSSPPLTLSNVPVNEIRITAISQTR